MEIVGGTLLLLIPAVLNGYPFVYPDTGTYLRQALELLGAADRPPYYSLLLVPLHLGLSLWPVAVAQTAAAVASLRLAAALVAPALRGATFLAAIASLSALTSLPWHSGQVVPDLFASLMPIWIFALAWGWAELGRGARLVLVLATAGGIATHWSHLPIAAALFAVAAALRAWQGAGRRDAARTAGIGAGVCAVATAGFLLYSLALIGRPVISPHGGVFLMSRLAVDGPAIEYLRDTCPASGNPFCKYVDRIPRDQTEFMWGADAPYALLTRELGPDKVREAADEVVAGAIATHRAEVALAAVRNTLQQLVLFGTLDTTCPPGCIVGSSVDVAIATHFPREYQSFRNSRQLQGEWPIPALRLVHGVTVILSVLVAALALARRRTDTRLTSFALLVVTAIAANAVATAALSGPWDRYGSRMIWLVPLTAILGVAAVALRPSAGAGPGRSLAGPP